MSSEQGATEPKVFRPDRDKPDPTRPRRGLRDEDLAARETVYRPDLLAGKTLLITGGGSGMGRCISVR